MSPRPRLLRQGVAIAVTFAALAACAGSSDDAESESGDVTEASTAESTSTDATTDTTEPDTTGDTTASTDATTTSTTTTTTTLPAPPTTVPRESFPVLSVDPETGEVTEEEVAAPGPNTFAEVVDAGVEAGIWDEIDGISRVLGYVLGALPAEQVPGADEVVSGELTELLDRAWQLNADGVYTPDELEPLRRRYEWFAPSIDELAATATPGERPQGFRRAAAPAACASIEVANFDSDAWIEGCYLVLEEVLPDATLRVFYPNWYEEDAALASLAGVTINAMKHSVERFRELGRVGDMDLVFSAVDTTDIYDEDYDGYTLASAWGVKPWDNDVVDTCAITAWPISTSDVTAYEQTIAHEVWHCVQDYDGLNYTGGTQNWWVEGGAEYFSNVAYPSANDEWNRLGTFDDAIYTPLYEMDYEVWPWWQHLANEFSPLYVADLQRQMMSSSGSGIELLDGYEETFHDFVADWVAGAIIDQSGATLPPAGKFNYLPVVTKDDEGTELTLTARSWAPVRFQARYDQELRIFESDASDGGLRSMVKWSERQDRAAFREIFPEVRSECRERARYAGVITDATSNASNSVELKIVIDEIEEAACDPCVLGTWSLDLDTFLAMIVGGIEAQGQALPPGTSFDLGGAYYVSMDDEDVVLEQRDGLEVILSMEGVGGFTITIDSFAEGTYSADGEVLTVNNLVESYNQVTSNLPFGGGSYSFPSAIAQGTGDYECDDDQLIVSIEEYPAVTFDRVDKILQPGDAPTDPTTQQPEG